MKKQILWGLVALLFLGGCQLSSAASTPIINASQTPPPATAPPTQLATATQISLPPTTTATPRSIADRVLIISVDGLRPEAISLAPMPNLLALMEEGVYSLTVQTTYPSATLPSHASMLTGMCPDKHGVDWNDYLPKRGYANSPSLFEIAHNAGLRTVMIVAKEKLQQITPPENADVFEFITIEIALSLKQLRRFWQRASIWLLFILRWWIFSVTNTVGFPPII